MSAHKRVPDAGIHVRRPGVTAAPQNILETLLGIPPTPRIQELKNLGKSPAEIETILEAEFLQELAEKPPIDELLNELTANVEQFIQSEVFALVSLWVDARKKKSSKRELAVEQAILARIEEHVLALRQLIDTMRSAKARVVVAATWRNTCLERVHDSRRPTQNDNTNSRPPTRTDDTSALELLLHPPSLSSKEMDRVIRQTVPKQIEQELAKRRRRPGRMNDPVIDRLWLLICEMDKEGASDKRIAAQFRKKNPRLGEKLKDITASKVAEVRANRRRREQNRK